MTQRACPHSWKYQVATQAGLVTTTEHCPHAPYVSLQFDTDPDQQGKAKGHVVRRLVFTTISHDQGFSSTQSKHQGTYEQSYTWFICRIITASGQDRLGIHPELCHNIHASLEFKEHVTVWDWEDENPSVVDWLSALQPGDTIQIVPRAKYPLWVNWVREAKIEMWVEIADSSDAQHNKGLAELIQENRLTYERYRPLKNGEKEIRVVDLHPAKDINAPLRLVLRYQCLTTQNTWTDHLNFARIPLLSGILGLFQHIQALPARISRRNGLSHRLYEFIGRALLSGTVYMYGLARLWYYFERKLLLVIPRQKLQFLKARTVRLLGVRSSRYDALSYCWGSHSGQDPPSLELSIEGLSEGRTLAFAITPNLHSALSQLRLKHRTRTLWIDYICINQIDIEERGQQVALMGEIFESAGSVCIWLGDSSPQIEEDCEMIRAISQHYKGGNRSTPVEASEAHKHLHSEPGSPESQQRLSFDRVFQKPWFSRVWVLQEAWRARQINVLCGSNEMDWNDVMQANQCMREHGVNVWDKTDNVMSRLWNALFVTSRGRWARELTCEPRRSHRDILTLLIAGHDMKATDPRDKIFALLAFGEETHQIRALPSQVRPNYGKDAILVFADFTRWSISHHQSLRILSAIHTLNGRSWISLEKPYISETKSHVSQRPSWSFWHEGRSEFVFGTLAAHRGCSYKASGSDHHVDINLMDEVATAYPLCLALRGWEVDVVSALAPYPFFQQQLSHSMDMQRAFIRIFDPVGRFGAWNDSGRSRTDIGDDATPMSELEFDEQMRELSHHYLAHWGSTPAAGKPDWIPCAGNCMFTTTRGLVGLCPAGVQAGDWVVILHGGNVPYIIRRATSSRDRDKSLEIDESFEIGDCHSFVGECFLDGMMNGEACNLKQPEQDRIFYLF